MFVKRLPFVLFPVFCLMASITFAEVRTWQSADGKSSVEAELISVEGNKIKMRLVKNNKVITTSLARFSQDDQQYVQQTISVNPGKSSSRKSELATFFPGQAYVQGLPIMSPIPFKLSLPKPHDHTLAQHKLRLLMKLMAAPERIAKSADKVEKLGWENAYLKIDSHLAEELYGAFYATKPDDRLFPSGCNEFFRAKALRSFAEQRVPQLMELAPKLPLEIVVLAETKLGAYAYESSSFSFGKIWAKIKPTTFGGQWGGRFRNPITIAYESELPIPSQLPLAVKEAEALLTSCPSRKIYVVSRMRINKLWSEGYGNTQASVDMLGITFYPENSLTTPIPIEGKSNSLLPESIRATESTPSSDADQTLDARMQALVIQHDLPSHSGLPLITTDLSADDRKTQDVKYGRFFDLVELTRTPDYLGLEALKGKSIDVFYTGAYAKTSEDRLRSVTPRFILWHSRPAEAANYINVHSSPRWGRYVDSSKPWKGMTQFEKRDAQKKFAAAYGEKLRKNAISLPLKFVVTTPVTLSEYNFDSQMFPFHTNDAIYEELKIAAPIATVQSPRARRYVAGIPFAHPVGWPVEVEQARGIAAANARSAAGSSGVTTLHLAHTVVINGVERAKFLPQERLPVVARVESSVLYADEELTQKIYEYEVKQGPCSYLEKSDSPEATFAKQADPNDPLAMASLIASKDPALLSDITWCRLWSQTDRLDREYYDSIRGANGYRFQNARKRHPSTTNGRTSPAQPSVIDQLLSPETVPFFPPGFYITSNRTGTLSESHRNIFEEWVVKQGKSLQSFRLYGELQEIEGEITLDLSSRQLPIPSGYWNNYLTDQLISTENLNGEPGQNDSDWMAFAADNDRDLEIYFILSNTVESIIESLPSSLISTVKPNALPHHAAIDFSIDSVTIKKSTGKKVFVAIHVTPKRIEVKEHREPSDDAMTDNWTDNFHVVYDESLTLKPLDTQNPKATTVSQLEGPTKLTPATVKSMVRKLNPGALARRVKSPSSELAISLLLALPTALLVSCKQPMRPSRNSTASTAMTSTEPSSNQSMRRFAI